MPRPRKPAGPSVVKGKLKVHNPFELIRWLALSQPDPRKATAELVQNSLDANASRIELRRHRSKKVACLSVIDNGEGVLPEKSRPDALRHIATHIGHSHKRSLSPQERLELMTQGQYGIGLLGFWSLGEVLEMRSFLPGQRPFRLILHRDRPDFLVEPIPRPRLIEEQRTEILVTNLHREALRALQGRRLSEFLASELRGQLLARGVDLVVEDRLTRGRAQRVFPVRPRRFLGERLQTIEPIDVPDHPPIQLELYLVGDDTQGTSKPIALFSAGTLVAESFQELANLDLDRPPWTDPRLTGLVDFPVLQITPGSRRGVVPDRVAGLFAHHLQRVETNLEAILADHESRRSVELDRRVLQKLRKAFRNLYRDRTTYSLLPVEDAAGGGENGDLPPTGETISTPQTELTESSVEELASHSSAPLRLFEDGPLASVELRPRSIRLVPGGSRRVRARPLDDRGRPIEDRVHFLWRLRDVPGRVQASGTDGNTVVLQAGEAEGKGTLNVVASYRDVEVGASASVLIASRDPSGSGEGVPEPELVHRPAAAWRSRIEENRWLVNTAHADYRACGDDGTLKLRYLTLLFAKEVVLRSTQDPRLAGPLEQLVEIASFGDRNTRRPGQRRR